MTWVWTEALEDAEPADKVAEFKPKVSEVPYWKKTLVDSPRGFTVAVSIVAFSVVEAAFSVEIVGEKLDPPEPTEP